jgi:hypothetical protein
MLFLKGVSLSEKFFLGDMFSPVFFKGFFPFSISSNSGKTYNGNTHTILLFEENTKDNTSEKPVRLEEKREKFKEKERP